MNVTVSKRVIRTRERWVLDKVVGGQRSRSLFTSKALADAEAEQLRLQVQKLGESWLALSPDERHELMTIWSEVTKAGLTLRQVWEGYRKKPESVSAVTLGAVIDELVKAKRNANRSKAYVSALESVLDAFSLGRREVPQSTLTHVEVEQFLDSHNIASRTTLRARLSTLFKFCVRRGCRPDNPCSRLEPVSVPKPPPHIFTTDQVLTCIQELHRWRRSEKQHSPRYHYRHALPWFILTTLCGLRPEEAEQTTAADVHMKEGWVKVEAQTSKVRQRRVVYPRPEAMRLLKRSIEQGGRLPLGHEAKGRAQKFLRGVLKLEAWPKDVTRHTAASYWLAAARSAADVAESLGNSEKVLVRDYKALVTKRQAAEFWRAIASTDSELAAAFRRRYRLPAVCRTTGP